MADNMFLGVLNSREKVLLLVRPFLEAFVDTSVGVSSCRMGKPELLI